MAHPRTRPRSTSAAAAYPTATPLAEPAEGRPTVYGSFTTTPPATLSLRAHLSLLIPVSRAADCGYDTPPDSPLSFFHSGSRRSPSISRTLTEFDWDAPTTSSPSLPSPSIASDDDAGAIHPILEALEKSSKLSCRTTCSACKKAGTNFPSCPRCHDMWCSRACRLQGGKKHICPNRKI